MEQQDVLTVLLTGRAEKQFSTLVKRIVNSRNLIFDMCCLKPLASPNDQLLVSTLAFKQAVLSDIVHTYSNAEEIRIYEDRPKQLVYILEYIEYQLINSVSKHFDHTSYLLIRPYWKQI